MPAFENIFILDKKFYCYPNFIPKMNFMKKYEGNAPKWYFLKKNY